MASVCVKLTKASVLGGQEVSVEATVVSYAEGSQ